MPKCSSTILLDDREAEAGAAHARRHIGLGDALALGGQADAVVGDLDRRARRPRSATASCAIVAGRPLVGLRLDRLDRILDDVGQRLADLAAVADHRRRRVGRIEREARSPGCATSWRNSAWRAISTIASSRNTGLGMRAKDENSSTIRRRSPTWRTIVPVSRSNVRAIGRRPPAVAALEPFGGELDRGQRVLDLVRDAPGDVGPGGAALIEQLLGDVVEGQDMAAARCATSFTASVRGSPPLAICTTASRSRAVEQPRRARARPRRAAGRRRCRRRSSAAPRPSG